MITVIVGLAMWGFEFTEYAIDINENGDYGIRFWNPAGTSASDRVHINNNVIISDSTAGSGVLFDTSMNSAP